MNTPTKTRRIVVTTTARDTATHELRTFVFRQPLKGRALRPVVKLAVCFESHNGQVSPFRAAMGGGVDAPTQEITRFRGHKFYAGDSQPAEYSARTKDAAIAQFKRDFKGWKVV